MMVAKVRPGIPGAHLVKFQQTSVYMFIGAGTVADLLMTATFVTSLWRKRSELVFSKRTNDLIASLIRYSISTYIVSSLVAIAVLIATAEYDGKASVQLTSSRIYHATTAHGGIVLIVPRIYSCTFLYVLNNRPLLRANYSSGHGDLTAGIISTPDGGQITSRSQRSQPTGHTGDSLRPIHMPEFQGKAVGFIQHSNENNFTADDESFNSGNPKSKPSLIDGTKEEEFFGNV